MGVSLVKVVLSATWANRLPDKAHVLFAHMAVMAMDRDQPPRYFGGRQDLALAIYGELDPDPKGRARQYRYVRKLLEAIKSEGGIHLMNADEIQTGRVRAEYEIRVMGRPGEELSGPPGGGTVRTSPGGTGGTSGGGPGRTEREVLGGPPKEHTQEPLEDLHEDPQPGPGRQAYVAARARHDAEQAEVSR